MNKALIVCAIGLLCSASYIQATKSAPDAPTWANTIDTVISSITELTDAIANDSLLYDNVKISLEQVHDQFDSCDTTRQEILNSIFSDIAEIHVIIQNAHNASQAALAAALLREQKLLQQLSSIKLETEAEIAHLNALVASITHELTETQKAYSTLININKTKTDELIQNLTTARDTYETMASKRTDFLDTLTQLVDRAKSYLQKSVADTEDICQRVSALTGGTLQSS